MKDLLSHSGVRRGLLWRGVEVLLLAGLVVACVALFRLAKEERVKLLRQEAVAETKPEYTLAVSRLQTELRDRAHDIARILNLVEDPNDIVGFIEDLEATARNFGVTVTVSNINELHEFDTEGNPLEAEGPFRSIELSLTGKGDGAQLLEYVHALEHTERLVVVQAWQIAYDPASKVAEQQLEAAREIEPTVPRQVTVPSAKLEAELILLVHNEKYSL